VLRQQQQTIRIALKTSFKTRLCSECAFENLAAALHDHQAAAAAVLPGKVCIRKAEATAGDSTLL
jgi:hypothetical protein